MNIGPIQFDHLMALAPMESVTGTPFRLICKRLGADLVYTEFTSSEALVRDIPKSLHKIQLTDEERPAAIQIFGSNEYSMAQAVGVAEKGRPDLIDINCGCWNKNHALRGEGAGLLLDLPRLKRILRKSVQATKLPVTVKTRLGWDEKNINILEVAKIVEQSGVKALTVHFRTRCQGYKGKADWTWLEKIKKTVSIPLIGNGDICTCQDVKRVFDNGCDGVMIGRGALANPWIFRQAKHYLKTGELLPQATPSERMALCAEHLQGSIAHHGLHNGVLSFRKYYAAYFHGLPFAAKFRAEIMGLMDPESIKKKLQDFLLLQDEIRLRGQSRLCAILK